MMLAVGQNGDALQFASPELRADKEVVLRALGSAETAIQWVDSSLLKDADVKKAQGQSFPVLPDGFDLLSIPDATSMAEMTMPSVQIPDAASSLFTEVSIPSILDTFSMPDSKIPSMAIPSASPSYLPDVSMAWVSEMFHEEETTNR